MEALSKMKSENRLRSEKQLMNSSMSQFECANTDKSQKTKERMQKYIQDEEAKYVLSVSFGILIFNTGRGKQLRI